MQCCDIHFRYPWFIGSNLSHELPRKSYYRLTFLNKATTVIITLLFLGRKSTMVLFEYFKRAPAPCTPLFPRKTFDNGSFGISESRRRERLAGEIIPSSIEQSSTDSDHGAHLAVDMDLETKSITGYEYDKWLQATFSRNHCIHQVIASQSF